MIDRSHGLSVARQAQALGGSRSSDYYLPRPASAADLTIMRRIDELHLELPFAGSRMLRDLLRQEGIEIGRQHAATLMEKMAIEAIYRRPNTSKPAPGHKIYPYLLRKLPIVRPNQVWATDISYIPMARGFVYLVAIVDWFSRKALAHRVSITMAADLCVEALEEALARYGKPEIFNTEQGSQFTSLALTSVLRREEIAISMDGRGARRDYQDFRVSAHGAMGSINSLWSGATCCLRIEWAASDCRLIEYEASRPSLSHWASQLPSRVGPVSAATRPSVLPAASSASA